MNRKGIHWCNSRAGKVPALQLRNGNASNPSGKQQAPEAAGGARQGEPLPIPGIGTFGYFKGLTGTPMGLIGP